MPPSCEHCGRETETVILNGSHRQFDTSAADGGYELIESPTEKYPIAVYVHSLKRRHDKVYARPHACPPGTPA